MRKHVDTMIVVPNERLLAVVGKGIPFQDALKKADEVLLHATQGISVLISETGSGERRLRRRAHRHAERRLGAHGHRHRRGENRAIEAAQQAIASPLLDNVSIAGATGVLVNITGGEDLTLGEVHQINEIVHDAVGDEAEIIFGAVHEPAMQGEIRVTVIATAAILATPRLPSPGAQPGDAVSGLGARARAARLALQKMPALKPFDLAAGALAIDPVIVMPRDEPHVDTIVVAGTITSSLYAALDRAEAFGLPLAARREIAWSLADIFEYRVDMSRDLKVGDTFSALVERVEQPDGRVSIRRVIGANLALSGQEISAIRFSSRHASGEWFDADGKSLQAAFLRAPLQFRRISSVFGMRRHPILGSWRQHAGTDYAAPSGTPVRSIGDGVVIFAGRRGGYGNVIDVRHRNGFVSRYGHLRNFAGGVRAGRRVAIGETIGYVGMSGLATGPHLHFEVLVGGVQRNPRVALAMRGGEPIASSERNDFMSTRERTLGALRSFSRAATGD
jgi:murein DD-endopeptidase MepM/ murein hydrolase activator NlpD